MIEHSAAYDDAITGKHRKIVPLVAFDLIDPDYVLARWSTNDEGPYSLTEQAVRRANNPVEVTTGSLEINRWILDGSITIEPDDKNDRVGQVGWEASSIGDEEGRFAINPYIEIEFTGVRIVQMMTIDFTTLYNQNDGCGVDFTVQFWGGTTLIDTLNITDNDELDVLLDGFTIYYPTRVRLTINRWSKGGRRVRVPRFLLGMYEDFDAKNISAIDIYTESTFSCLNIPYSTCSVEIYNKNHMFDPYAPNSVFASIEERQAVTVKLGTRLESGEIEWIPCGRYYQQSGNGWQLKDLTIQFNLLDMIGMLTKRNFIVPKTLPTTLEGWVQAIVSSMGVNFTDQYRVDAEIANLPLTAAEEDVTGKTCGVILRFACMATNTWPHQDMSTGRLWISKILYTEGNRITLNDMSSYPVMSENSQIADITFLLDKDADGNVQTVTFPGTNTESEVSINVSNPFVHSVDDARMALMSCMFEYGGKSFQVTHRGNPTSETGDIQSIDTQFLTTISARLYKQQLKLQDGVMHNVPSYLVQSPNDSVYQNKVVLTGNGTWVCPIAGTIKITVIGGGNGGQGGGGGTVITLGGSDKFLDGGAGGDPGKVFIVEIEGRENQEFVYRCGSGGGGGAGGERAYFINSDYNTRGGTPGYPGGAGGETVFGVFTSTNGVLYPNGVMDVQSGTVYAQKGPDSGGKVTGSYGSGGVGGIQGKSCMKYWHSTPGLGGWWDVTGTPEDGLPGYPGQPGCVIVEW